MGNGYGGATSWLTVICPVVHSFWRSHSGWHKWWGRFAERKCNDLHNDDQFLYASGYDSMQPLVMNVMHQMEHFIGKIGRIIPEE